MNPSKTKINLSKKSRSNIQNVVYSWVINIGRIIIVLTELMALSALFYRFLVDKQIIDLHDRIKREETILSQQEGKESEYRNIQERLKLAESITESTEKRSRLLSFILNRMQTGNIQITNFEANQNGMIIDGNASSIFSINNFVNELKTYPDVLSIVIDEINGTETGVKFKLRLGLKTQGS